MSTAKKVLIVEDEPDLLNTYSEVLTQAGYQIVKSKDGVEAMFRMRSGDFDLVITDIKMPRLSGDKMIETLLASNINSNSQIIISSGYVDQALTEKFKNEKRIHFLAKPVDTANLLIKVRSLLGQGGGSSVDVRVINPVIEGALQIVSPAFEDHLRSGKPHIKQDNEVSGDISAIVGLVSNSFRGNIALSFLESSYFKVASKNLGVEIKELNEDARDAIGEIIRLIFEKAKEQFEKDSLSVNMTNPSIISDKRHSVSHQSRTPPIVILFENGKMEGFRIEISST